eukprot:COSAG06_NODE_8171_length_2251_cov_1.225372_3_plen_44_part_00
MVVVRSAKEAIALCAAVRAYDMYLHVSDRAACLFTPMRVLSLS